MKITKYGHACLLIEEGDARILIDPGVYSSGFEDLEKVDAVLVTHQHQDHVMDETLDKVRAKNPDVKVYADEGTARILEGDGITAVKEGDNFTVGGAAVEVYGADHAVIHPDIPGIENVGYMIASRFFYPGDSFTKPESAVEVLALPAGAPWLKISEAVDYVMDIKPKVAIPVHDAVLAIPQMNYGILRRFTEPAGIELRVVLNGESTEV